MATESKLGGIVDVPDADHNSEIQKLAHFAVNEYNKKEHARLEYVKVISATQQVVEGFIFCIVLEAKNGELIRKYEAEVWDKADSKKELVQFKPLLTDTLSVSA